MPVVGKLWPLCRNRLMWSFSAGKREYMILGLYTEYMPSFPTSHQYAGAQVGAGLLTDVAQRMFVVFSVRQAIAACKGVSKLGHWCQPCCSAQETYQFKKEMLASHSSLLQSRCVKFCLPHLICDADYPVPRSSTLNPRNLKP